MINIVKTKSNWYVYLVRAANDKLYCGISNDPVVRFYKHCCGKGAKFFLMSQAVALVYIEQCTSKSQALQRERTIKQLTKQDKEQLINNVDQRYLLPLFYNKSKLLTLADIML